MVRPHTCVKMTVKVNIWCLSYSLHNDLAAIHFSSVPECYFYIRLAKFRCCLYQRVKSNRPTTAHCITVGHFVVPCQQLSSWL